MDAATLTMTPADLFKYRNDLVRTKKYLALGRVRTIAIGPCSTYKPPAIDPIINGWGDQPQRHARGRMIDLTGQWLPIGQDTQSGQILITAPLRRRDGRVGLPDLADPTWRAPDFTEEEAMDPNKRDPSKDQVRLIPQRLEDRTNDQLMGSNFMVFQPVERITYQPEETRDGKFSGFRPAEWRIRFGVDGDGHHCAFLVDYNPQTGQGTGECHFFGGIPFFEADARG
jgi:hypothetical protein